MKLLYLFVFTVLSFNSTPVDPIDKFAELIGKGNVHELAKLFAPTIELTLMDNANTYSKAQAEIILTQFFNQNKPVSSKMLHKVNSNSNFIFGVVIINTDKGPFRASFTLKQMDGNMQLIELRLESEKVK
jgi:hypothetical protein